MNQHFWWYLARATGIVAWALATGSVLWGMALSTRALGSRPRAPWLLDLHRFLGGLTVAFVGVHLLSLAADSYVEFSWRDLFVPMASNWKPGAVAWGVAAFYLLVAVEVTSLLMQRLPRRIWRAIHLASYVTYVLATVHFLTAGTDSGLVIVRLAAIVSTAAIVFFVAYLLVGPGRAASARPSRPVPRSTNGGTAGSRVTRSLSKSPT
ncbi:MAG: ferric reductase-like transmembrane domain-containing protein [Acidimicrobiales bacterium]|nr:ferric reductase-like transmembrane domain-containing protein [Acidimicrobiales bacterium]